MLLLLVALALAAPWLELPPGEPAAEWASAFALAGTAGPGGLVRVRIDGETWVLTATGSFGERTARVPRPRSERAREDLVLLAASLLAPGPVAAVPMPRGLPVDAPSTGPTGPATPALPPRPEAPPRPPAPAARAGAAVASPSLPPAPAARAGAAGASPSQTRAPAATQRGSGAGAAPVSAVASTAVPEDPLTVAGDGATATPSLPSEAPTKTSVAPTSSPPAATPNVGATTTPTPSAPRTPTPTPTPAPASTSAVESPAAPVPPPRPAATPWGSGAGAAPVSAGAAAPTSPAAPTPTTPPPQSDPTSTATPTSDPPRPRPAPAPRVSLTAGPALTLREGLEPGPGARLGGHVSLGGFTAGAQLSASVAYTDLGHPLTTARAAALLGARAPGGAGVYAGVGPAADLFVFRQEGTDPQTGVAPALLAEVGAGIPVTAWLRVELYAQGGLDLRGVAFVRRGETLAELGRGWIETGIQFRAPSDPGPGVPTRWSDGATAAQAPAPRR